MQHKLGNIRENSLLEIFNSKKAIWLRDALKTGEAFKLSPCANCSSFETFKGFTPSFDS